MQANIKPDKTIFYLFLPQNLPLNSTRISTLLASTGIKIFTLIEDYNNKVSKLPEYFKIRITLTIQSNKIYFFKFNLPTIGFILSITKYLYTNIFIVNKRKIKQEFYVVTFKILIKICLLKFNKCTNSLFKMVYATAKAMGLRIIK